MSRSTARLRALFVRVGYAIGRLRRPQPRVILATAHLDTISGNLAAIRDGLAALRPDVAVTILASRPPTGLGRFPRAAAQALVAGYHLATARLFVVDDYYFPMYVVPRRPRTTSVQVWHACGAFKRFGYSVLDRSFGADEAFVAAMPIHTNYDLCFVSAMRFAPFYAEAFRQPIGRFTSAFGIPRTDLFFDADRVARVSSAIRTRYRIPTGRRVVLYAPTFRGATILEARSPDQLDLAALRARLGDDHVVLVRAHPFVRAAFVADPALDGFAIDVSDHPDMNELMLVADVLVTDYSSAIYEFALLERPIVFFAPDHAAYEAERGFYFDFSAEAPGPIVETTEALAHLLRRDDLDLERVRRFRAASFDLADGQATRRFVERLAVPAVEGRLAMLDVASGSPDGPSRPVSSA